MSTTRDDDGANCGNDVIDGNQRDADAMRAAFSLG
jgi:hypothetical protein